MADNENMQQPADGLLSTGGIIAPTISPASVDATPAFVPMLTGVATNELVSLTGAEPTVDPYTGSALIEKGTFKVFIDGYRELKGLRISTFKLLDMGYMVLTQSNHYRDKSGARNTIVNIPIERYMELCGIPLTKPSKDKTRRKVAEDIETLYHTSLEWTEASGKNQRDFEKRRIFEAVAIKRGVITLEFTAKMADYLTGAYLTQFSTALFALDERNRNAYPLGRKILLHHGMDSNRKKGTANILSVSSLLQACPDIPSYEQVMSENRTVAQRIKEPLEKALDSIPFLTWEYANSKGVPLTPEQLDSTDWQSYSSLYVLFEVQGAPDQTARLEAKAEKAKEKKRKRAAKKKAE